MFGLRGHLSPASNQVASPARIAPGELAIRLAVALNY
jgi:hypothetical protein